MRNFVLLLVLGCGMASGYFVGDYRGKEARAALEKAIAMGMALDREREAVIASLRKDLADIDAKYQRDLEASRRDYEARSVEWQRAKAGLDETIRRQTARIAAANQDLEKLRGQLDGATGDERVKLEQEIARLRKVRADLQRELDGNRCLGTPVPQSVFDALGGAANRGGT